MTAPADLGPGPDRQTAESAARLDQKAVHAGDLAGHDQRIDRFDGGDDPRARVEVLEWLMWQMGGLGPMLGQNGHFKLYAPEPVPYAIQRYEAEALRLYGVLDRQLERTGACVAGDYSIADMACYPWIVPHKRQGQLLDDFPDLKRWFETIAAKPSTVRAYAKGKELQTLRPSDITDAQKALLFGQTAANTRAG
mgnify:CR=1 FL=1